MKTAEITGATLDYWVARAEGLEATIHEGHCYTGLNTVSVKTTGGWVPSYSPSSQWACGGPIIDRNLITLHAPGTERADADSWAGCLIGEEDDGLIPSYWGDGSTALEAAMRAFVASRFGETLPDEVQL